MRRMVHWLARRDPDIPEVQLRVGVRGQDRSAVERFTKEIAPLILTGPPAVTGFAGGRPKVEEIVAYWPALIPKEEITPVVEVLEDVKVQLTKLAHARSGDKGDTANVGLIALKDEFYPILVREVTAERVKQHFKGICHGEVERFELPNLGALNFLLHESLGGGGTLSLMTDAQGKTFSTALLADGIEITDKEAAEFTRMNADQK